MKRLLAILSFILLANQASAEVYVFKQDCKDAAFEAALYNYNISLKPIWFTKSFPSVLKMNDDDAKRWFDQNKSKFFDKLEATKPEILSLREFNNSPKNPYISCNVGIIIFDEITEKDVAFIEAYLGKFANPPFLQVQLLSEGGEIIAAVKLGRIVREHYGLVTVGLSEYDYELLGEQLKKLDGRIKYADWLVQNKDKEDTDDYQTVLKAYDEVSQLHYTDEPLLNAQKVAKVIKHYRWQTGCYSACTLIYVGGVSRKLELDMRTSKGFPFGLHQHFIDEKYLDELDVADAVKLLQDSSTIIKTYLSDMGISEDLFQLASSVTKDDLLLLEEKKLSEIVPFVQAEYGAVIPEKVQEANVSIASFIANVADEVSGEIAFGSFVELINKRRKDGDNPILWANYNSYHITSGQFSQKFWRDR